jgi:hypothetical protein
MNTPQSEPSTSKALDIPKNTEPKAKGDKKPQEAKTKAGAPAATKKPAKKAVAKKAAAKKAAAKKASAETTAKSGTAKKKPAPKESAKPVTKASPAVTTDAKAKRVKKEKVVRDSFTMPKSDYAKLASLKQKCQANGLRVRKSELLRAALTMLDAASDKALVSAIEALETVKTGRPSNA